MVSPVDGEAVEPPGLLKRLLTARTMTSVGHWPPTDRDGLVRHRGRNSNLPARGGSAHRIPERLHISVLLAPYELKLFAPRILKIVKRFIE